MADLSIKFVFDKENAEYQRNLNMVKFCKENGFSVPSEVERFFAGPRLSGVPVDVKSADFILQNIADGFEISGPVEVVGDQRRIRVSEIPAGAEEIIVTLVA